jgi:hypothetical protein
MELDHQSLFGIHVLCKVATPTPPPPHPPAFWLIYEGAISQPRKTTSLSDSWCAGSEPQRKEESNGFGCSRLRYLPNHQKFPYISAGTSERSKGGEVFWRGSGSV